MRSPFLNPEERTYLEQTIDRVQIHRIEHFAGARPEVVATISYAGLEQEAKEGGPAGSTGQGVSCSSSTATAGTRSGKPARRRCSS